MLLLFNPDEMPKISSPPSFNIAMKKAFCFLFLLHFIASSAFAGIDIVRSSGITLTGADGVHYMGTSGITVTGAEGFLAFDSNGIPTQVPTA